MRRLVGQSGNLRPDFHPEIIYLEGWFLGNLLEFYSLALKNLSFSKIIRSMDS